MTDDTTDDSTAAEGTASDNGAPDVHTGSTWKVLGEIDAPDGTGVLGHNTATSGTAQGVAGVTDSQANGATGVFGHATTSGTAARTFGVEGVTEADADPPNQVFPAGVRGRATGTGGVSGVIGLNENDPGGLGVGGVGMVGTGVFGRAYAGTDSTNAIDGWASATTGQTVGVRGRTDSAEGGATGVTGQATTSGTATEIFGVTGVTHADGSGGPPALKTAGVYGTAPGDSVTHGVFGEVSGPDSVGVVGANIDGDYVYEEGYPAGVVGGTDRSGAESGVTAAAGVVGSASATSGSAAGVTGLSQSPDGAGVRGVDNSGEGYGLMTAEDARVGGTQEVGGGTVHEQRGDPDTTELADGEVMTFNSDGSGTGAAGDLVYAVNDGGSILTSVIAERSAAS